MRPASFFSLALIVGFSLGPAGLCPAGEPISKDATPLAEERNYFPFLGGNYTLGGQFSEDLNSGYFDSMTPLWAPGQAMFILNTRTTYDDNDELDSNYGLVARYRLPDRDVIFGVNASYDLISSQHDNDFASLGLGAEILTHWVDARFNYSAPEDDRTRIETGRRSSARTFEAALEGWNAEVGFLVPGLERYLETRLFGGYYRYDNPFGEEYEGFNARLETHFLPGIVGEVEYWDDAYLTGGHWTAGVRVTVPFSFHNLVTGGNPFAGAGDSFRPREREFKERMTDLVMRSHRVKTVASGNP